MEVPIELPLYMSCVLTGEPTQLWRVAGGHRPWPSTGGPDGQGFAVRFRDSGRSGRLIQR